MASDCLGRPAALFRPAVSAASKGGGPTVHHARARRRCGVWKQADAACVDAAASLSAAFVPS